MKDEGWLELVEVLPTPKINQSSFSKRLDHEDTGIHIFLTHNNEDDCEIPFTSVVLQASLSPEFINVTQKVNCNESGEQEEAQCDSSHDILLRLHPILFLFLHYASRLNATSRKIQTDENRNAEQQSPSSVTVHTSGVSDDRDVRVHLYPLPILSFQEVQTIAQEQQQIEEGRFWKCRSVKFERLKRGSHIYVSCMYVEGNILLSSESKNEEKMNEKGVLLDQVIGTALEGRIVKAGSVLLLSTIYGYVIAHVTKIISVSNGESTKRLDFDDMQSCSATYRLSNDAFGCYHCHVEVPQGSSHDQNETQVISGATKWESDIPGYESYLKQIIDTFSIHGDVASASGVLLTGCAGVGKSRLASCVACHYIENGNFNKYNQQGKEQKIYKPPRNTALLNQTLFYSSVQDLIFQASVEANLFENVLDPRLKGCKLWIIDDLNLLETEAGNGDEAELNNELIIVRNALTEAIDRFKLQCCILGIAQSESNLPPELTKSGRLETTIQMFPPSHLQRIEIWKHVLSNDFDGRKSIYKNSTDGDLVGSLASSTAGCVPKDLLQIHRDALLKMHSRETRQSNEKKLELKWDDLKEAIQTSIPSQLSELDVIRPTIFDKQVSWKEIHRRSWQNFGGYSLLKRSVYRQVVLPWRLFLQTLDESFSETVTRNEKTQLDPPPGVLFHGISGTGKTTAAKCLAVSLGIPIIQIRATDLLDKWLGGSESLLRSLFMRARSVSPCILFIDEIDAIACNRENDDNNDVSSRILSTLLNEIDGVSTATRKNRVLVIACTNRIRSIDSALLRPGRLQEHFYMERPGIVDYEEILRLYLRKIPIDKNLDMKILAKNLFDIRATGADVEGLCRDATFIAMRRHEFDNDSIIAVSQMDFEVTIAERYDACHFEYEE